MSASACYTYAVTRPFDIATVADVRGVDDAAICLLQHRDIVAVASAMPPEAADENAVRARLETMDSVAATARAHHAVVDAVAAHGAVVPFRLATIHRDQRRVIDLLRERYVEFEAALDRLAGRVEMGVKVYAAASARAPVTMAAPGGASPGRDYLRARRAERDQRERGTRHAVDVADRVDTTLAETAVERTQHRPQATQLRDDHAENILNAAYLVQADELPAFHALVRQLGTDAPELRIEVTGPWPPYSFAGLDRGDEP